MNVMVVEEGEGALFFVCQALEALGARIHRSPSMDEDKVLIYKIDVVLHHWSEFTEEIEMQQVRALKEGVPDLLVVIFAPANDVAHLRRVFRHDLVADMRALDGPYAARTAEAIVQQLRARRPEAAAAPAV